MNRAVVIAVCWASLVALLAGCTARPRKRAAPDPYFIERHVDALEGQVASLTRRLEEIERRQAQLSEHPWFSSVGEHPLGSLPRPSEGPASLAERRPPPEFPSPSASKKAPRARARERLAPPAVGEKRASPLSRLTRLVRPPSVRERSADELLRLGRRYLEAGEVAAALEKLHLYLERAKDGTQADEAHVLVGRAELARGRPLVAAASFRRVLDNAPDSPERPEALYYAGEAFHGLHDKVQALKRWKELVERYPSNPLAAKAREAIRRMAAER